MSPHDERQRTLIADQAADWFVTNRGKLLPVSGRILWPGSRPLRYMSRSISAWPESPPIFGTRVLLRPLRRLLVARARGAAEPVRTLATADDTATLFLALASARRGIRGGRDARPRSVRVVGLRVAPRFPTPEAAVTLRFETRHGEHESHRLPDLRCCTSIRIVRRLSYSNSERIVVLTAGEADFEVIHDPKRPFRVFAGPAEMVDIGTQFDVRLEHGATIVTVLAGQWQWGPLDAACGAGFQPVTAGTVRRPGCRPADHGDPGELAGRADRGRRAPHRVMAAPADLFRS